MGQPLNVHYSIKQLMVYVLRNDQFNKVINAYVMNKTNTVQKDTVLKSYKDFVIGLSSIRLVLFQERSYAGIVLVQINRFRFSMAIASHFHGPVISIRVRWNIRNIKIRPGQGGSEIPIYPIFSPQDTNIPKNCKIFDTEYPKLP